MTAPLPSFEQAVIDALNRLAIDAGTVTSVSPIGSNQLADTSKAWPPNIHRNRIVKVIIGQGAGQSAYIQGNSSNSLISRSLWVQAVGIGAVYVILSADYEQMLRDVLGGGSNISATNPLPVDITAAPKTTQTILTLANLAAGATSLITQGNSLDLRGGPGSLALTVVATYNAAATLGLRVHIRTSPDNTNWDSEDWDAWTAGFTAGVTIRETENYVTDPMYLRILIENLDPARAITNISVIASVGA